MTSIFLTKLILHCLYSYFVNNFSGYLSSDVISHHIMSIYPFVRIQLSYVQLSMLWYEFYDFIKNEIYEHYIMRVDENWFSKANGKINRFVELVLIILLLKNSKKWRHPLNKNHCNCFQLHMTLRRLSSKFPLWSFM